MISIPPVAQVVRAVLTTTANRAARAPRWVPRRSKLSGAKFVQTVGFGWVANPDARDEELAQTAATLGREFSYELLRAVAPTSETKLQTALTKFVEAEILYQRGVGEQARYFFKHALIQDAAYQPLLKSTRQQYHQQVARILEERFPNTKET